MIKQTVTYLDFNGQEVTEDLYFNLTNAEYVRLTGKVGGDISDYAQQLVALGKHGEMLEFIENLILSSYGVRTPDGRGFKKTKEIRENFEYSIAFSEIFEMLLSDPDKASAFASGLMSMPGKPNAVQAQPRPQLPRQVAEAKPDNSKEVLDMLSANPELLQSLLNKQSEQAGRGINNE